MKMKYNYKEDSLNVMDTCTGTIIGRSPAGVYIQLDDSIQFGFAKNFQSLRSGTRVIASVKYPPRNNSNCIQLEIDSILSYVDAA